MKKQSLDTEHQFRATLNRKGWMLIAPDAVMLEFITHSASQALPVLDVGATYGVASLAALKAGCQVIATDLDPRHLEALEHDAAAAGLRDSLTTASGRFPEAPVLQDGAVGAVLLSRVLTFMEPASVRATFTAVKRALSIGGKVFGTADTPYLANFAGFREEFQRRLAAGIDWPGWIPDTAPFIAANKEVTATAVHLFTPEVIRREIELAGLVVERVEYIDRAEYPPQFRSGGRESVAFVAGRER